MCTLIVGRSVRFTLRIYIYVKLLDILHKQTRFILLLLPFSTVEQLQFRFNVIKRRAHNNFANISDEMKLDRRLGKKSGNI